MKKTSAIIVLVLVIALSFTLSGCAVNPYEIEWYLEYYIVDGEWYYPEFHDYDHFHSAIPGRVMISFDENNKFYFRDYHATEYSGTYTFKYGFGDTEVSLTFSDNSKVTGSCMECHWGYGGIWYAAEFEILGVSYHFIHTGVEDTEFQEESYYKEIYGEYLTNVAKSASDFYKTNGNSSFDEGPKWYRDYENAIIEKVDDGYQAVIGSRKFSLSEYKFWCYFFNEEELKPAELQEGSCIARYDGGSIAIYYPEEETSV